MVAAKKRNIVKLKSNVDYTINVTRPSQDKILDINAFVNFLRSHIKVDNKVNNLGDFITIDQKDGKVHVVSRIEFSKRYLKYLTKKFLKKYNLRNWIRVVATGPRQYDAQYYNVHDDDEMEE